MKRFKGVPIVGKKIAALRETLFLTQDELAAKMGITNKRLSAVENAKEPVGIHKKRFRALADAAGLSPESLLEKIGANVEAEATFTDVVDDEQDPREETRKRLSERARQEASRRAPEPTKEPK